MIGGNSNVEFGKVNYTPNGKTESNSDIWTTHNAGEIKTANIGKASAKGMVNNYIHSHPFSDPNKVRNKQSNINTNLPSPADMRRFSEDKKHIKNYNAHSENNNRKIKKMPTTEIYHPWDQNKNNSFYNAYNENGFINNTKTRDELRNEYKLNYNKQFNIKTDD